MSIIVAEGDTRSASGQMVDDCVVIEKDGTLTATGDLEIQAIPRRFLKSAEKMEIGPQQEGQAR